MQRFLLSAALVMPLIGARAESPEPSRAAIARAAQSCTADGAFGHRFGEKTASPATMETGIPPFRLESLRGDDNGLFEISAMAWFGKAPMSGEDRIALARWVFGALDAEAGKRGFAKRDMRPNGVTYHSNADATSGYTLDIAQDGVTVRIDCTDMAGKRHA